MLHLPHHKADLMTEGSNASFRIVKANPIQSNSPSRNGCLVENHARGKGELTSCTEFSSPYSGWLRNAVGPHHPHQRKNSRYTAEGPSTMIWRNIISSSISWPSHDEWTAFGPSAPRTGRNQPTGQKLCHSMLKIH